LVFLLLTIVLVLFSLLGTGAWSSEISPPSYLGATVTLIVGAGGQWLLWTGRRVAGRQLGWIA
jgi:protein-S-isoprenylcysteine O-methyltransferase Ste14